MVTKPLTMSVVDTQWKVRTELTVRIYNGETLSDYSGTKQIQLFAGMLWLRAIESNLSWTFSISSITRFIELIQEKLKEWTF